MLEEYKELCKLSADIIPDWAKMSKNELCRAYVENKQNPVYQNAYFSAILYKYWHLIGKYYYMSANCATPEECYSWLVDSISCCVNLVSWEDPNSSIYGDPNGPDKVINRCMKCARLTYYQFINRKKRKDDFNLMSIDELKDAYGSDVTEIHDYNQEVDVSSIVINEFIVQLFQKKDYFLCFMLDCILHSNVFDITIDKSNNFILNEFNLRKLCTELKKIDDQYIESFSKTYELSLEDVMKAAKYVSDIPPSSIRKKVTNSIESLRHSNFIKSLRGVCNANRTS